MKRNVISGLCICLIGVLSVTGLIVAAANDSRVADAAMSKDRDTVKTLLKQAVDVNAAQGDGMTALHWAALNGDAELAQVLVYAGANVKATTRLGGYTPLYMAAKSGSSSVIDVLLKAGSDPKAGAIAGLTPLHMAAGSGNVEATKLLLEKGADPNAKETESGQTPLSFAAAFNRADVIKLLASKGADVNLATKVRQPVQQQRGEVPGQQFQQRGQQQGQQQGQQAQAGAAAAAPAQGQAAAQQGGRGGRGGRGGGQAPAAPAANAQPAGQQAAAAPAPGAPAQAAPVQGRGQQGQAQQGQQQQQQGNGADAEGRGGGNLWGAFTPLMYAARQGNEEASKALMDAGAKLDDVSADKSTPLLLSIINGHFDLAKIFIERGSDVNKLSVDGATPLYVVANTQWAKKSFYPQPTARYEKTTYIELMTLLLDKGADPNAKLAKDLWYSEYNFSLSNATQTGSSVFWKCAEVGDIEGMRLLVSRGADPYASNRDGVNALLIASGAGTHGNDDVQAPPGRLEAVKYLVEELHLDVNSADKAPAGGGGPFGGGGQQQDPAQQRETAIRLATQLNNGQAPSEEQIQEQLRFVQQQAQQGGFGRGRGGGITALHNAAARGDNEMILYLVSKGAKVDVVANSGQSVVDAANGPRQRVQPYPETVALLEMLGAKNSHKCISC